MDDREKGEIEAIEFFESHEFDAERCHEPGKPHEEPGDIFLPVIGAYLKVEVGQHVPEKLYDWLSRCPNAIIRRKDESGKEYPWIRMTLVNPNQKLLSIDLRDDTYSLSLDNDS